MDATKTTTNWIIAGLVALVVIIGGGWLIARERSGSMATNATSTGASSGEEIATGTDSTQTSKPNAKPTAYVSNPTTSSAGETVSVTDQKEGSSVVVADVSISKPTWIAVRDARPWYLGWKLLKSGQQNVTIPLQRNTTAGQSYEVVLFVDNGDGQFAIHGGDTLVTSASGAPVSSTFKVE